MTESAIPPDDLRSCQQWCDKARELLQVKGWKAAFSGADLASDAMKGRIDEVVKWLRNMQSDSRMADIPTFRPLYGQFLARFKQLAAEAKAVVNLVAGSDGSEKKSAVKAISQDLELLRLEIIAHISVTPNRAGASAALAEHREALLRDSRPAFLQAARAANDLIVKAATRQGISDDELNDPLNKARALVRQASEVVEARLATVTGATAEDANKEIRAQTAQLAQVQQVLDSGKNAAAQRATQRQQDLEALPRYRALLREAEGARQELELLQGAEKQLIRIQELLGQVRTTVKEEGGLVVGCAAAIPRLERVPAILSAGKADHEAWLSKPLPGGLQVEMTNLLDAIERLRPVVPGYVVDSRTAAANELSRRGKDSRDEATLGQLRQEIGRAAQEIRDDVVAATRLRTMAEEKVREVEGVLGTVDANAHGRSGVAQVVARVKGNDLPEKEWRRALDALEGAAADLQGVRDRFRHAGEWNRILPGITAMIETFPPALLQFGATAPQALVVSLLLRDIRDEVVSSGDYQRGVLRFQDSNVAARFQDLTVLARRLPARGDLEAFHKLKWELEVKIDAARFAATSELAKVTQRLRGIADPAKTPMQARIDAALAGWRTASVAAEAAAQLQTACSAAETEFTRVVTNCRALLADKAALARYQSEAQAAESQRDDEGRRARVRDLLAQLGALGDDVSAARSEFNRISLAAVVDAEAWADLERRLVDQLDGHRAETAAAAAALRARSEQLRKIMASAKIPGSFSAVKAALANECKDLEALASSADPQLIAAGEAAAAALAHRLAGLSDGSAYGKVEALTVELSKKVGDANLKKCMPDTYRRLYADLQATIVEARRSEPAAGLTALEKVEAEIAQAIVAAQQAAAARAVQQQRRADLEALWRAVKKKHTARFTLEKRPVETYVEARLADFDAALLPEGGVQVAARILDELFRKLQPMHDQGEVEARLLLGELDAECAGVETRVLELARQFNVELDAFNKDLLAAVVEHARQPGADVDAAKTVGAVAKAAVSLVNPYLKLLKTLPHQKRGAQPAPELAKAEAAFARARAMLAEGAQSARRLLGMTASTNVGIQRDPDFGKVEADWRQQVSIYNAAVQDLASQLRQAAKQLSVGANPINGDAKRQIEQAAGNVAAAGTIFMPLAFAQPFAVLGGKADKPAKSAAREVALRTMRELREQLLKNALLRRLTAADNPFNAKDMMAATAGLRAALKRIEIETLIGA